jgi:predicted PurR-regulated permease PerM
MSSDYVGKIGFSRRPRRRIQRRSQLLEPTSEAVQISVQTSASPHWSPITKLLVGLVIVGIVAFLFNRFASLVTPLLMIIIIVYLLHPVASALARGLGVSWKVAVHILFLVILLSLIGLLTLGGVGLVGQIQSLIGSVQTIIADLPEYLAQLSTWQFTFGPFRFDMSTLMRTVDLNALSQQLLSFIQPMLGRTGTLIGTLASGAVETFGWTFFVLIVSYFIMIESSGFSGDLFRIDLPGYSEDLRRLGRELSRIWNAFLRGQIIIFVLAVVIYSILLPILGVRYALGIALMAGLAKFLPYIGPAITWVVMALVTFFQGSHPFGLSPLWHMALVVIITSVIDWIIDSFITPRIMASTLKVHPAAVLVAALVAANLLGLLGVVIAAPFLASVTLLGKYTIRKMFDLDPWPEAGAEPEPHIGAEWLARLRSLYYKNRLKLETKKEKTDGQP